MRAGIEVPAANGAFAGPEQGAVGPCRYQGALRCAVCWAQHLERVTQHPPEGRPVDLTVRGVTVGVMVDLRSQQTRIAACLGGHRAPGRHVGSHDRIRRRVAGRADPGARDRGCGRVTGDGLVVPCRAVPGPVRPGALCRVRGLDRRRPRRPRPDVLLQVTHGSIRLRVRRHAGAVSGSLRPRGRRRGHMLRHGRPVWRCRGSTPQGVLRGPARRWRARRGAVAGVVRTCRVPTSDPRRLSTVAGLRSRRVRGRLGFSRAGACRTGTGRPRHPFAKGLHARRGPG